MHDCQCGTAELLLRLPVTWHDERSDGASAMQLDRSTSERINRTLLQRPAADKGSKLRTPAAPRTSTRTHQATDSASRKSPLHAGAWTKSPTRSEATCRRFAGMTFESRQTSTSARSASHRLSAMAEGRGIRPCLTARDNVQYLDYSAFRARS